ncbi:MAG: hypothetical protein J5J00_01025 [Deltaproteobacteria bacterium]|nr:hypothetical protein [Deltaproteobacteria bacterium]
MADADNSQQDCEAYLEPFHLFKTTWRTHSAAIAGLLATLLLIRWQAITLIDSHYLGGFLGDAGLYSWLIQSNLRDLFVSSWFDTAAFYPYGTSLAWSDNFILPSLVAFPLLKLGLPLVTSFNVIILVSNFLNGYAVWRLFHKLTGDNLSAFVSGASFMMLAPFTYHLGHPQLQFFFFIPFSLLLLVNFINKPKVTTSAAIGFLFFCCFLTTVYYAVFLALAVAATVTGVFLLRPRSFRLKPAVRLIAGGVAGALPVVPFVLPYLEVRGTFGGRQLYEAYYFAASGSSFLSSPPLNLLYGNTSSLSHSEAHFFPGLTILLLAMGALLRLGQSRSLRPRLALFISALIIALSLSIWWDLFTARFLASIVLWVALIAFVALILRMGRLEQKLGFERLTARDLNAIFALIALLFLILSFGPLGNPEKGHPSFSLYRVLYEVLPGLDSIRAVSRLGLVYLFAPTMLFGLQLTYLSKQRKIGAAVLLTLPFIWIENYQTSYPLEQAPPAPRALSPLSNKIDDGAVMMLPFAGPLDRNKEVSSWSKFAMLNVAYMHWGFASGRKIVNGYSGQRTKVMREMPRELQGFPDKRAVTALSQIAGLKYLVYNSTLDKSFNAFDFNARLRGSEGSLRLVHEGDDGSYLFELTPELKVTDDTTLLAPARKGNKLVLEARGRARREAILRLEIFVAEEFDLLQVGRIQVSEEWQKYEIDLPAPSNQVRPRRITFGSDPDHEILIRAYYIQ